MQVQFGNPAPVHSPNGEREPLPGPAVTHLSIPDGEDVNGVSLYGVVDGHDVAGFDADGAHETTLPRHPAELMLQIAQNGHLLTRAAGHEALLSAVATWTAHSSAAPSWVWSDNPELERQLSEWYGCPVGIPDFVEETHFTLAGPPGVIPLAVSPEANTLKSGLDSQWRQMFAGAGQAGATGTSTATSATSMTDSGAAWGITAYVGGWVVCGSAIANILSHTGTVLTLDRWYTPSSRGGAAAATPGGTTAYVILPSAGPSDFMGLSANVTAVDVTADTTLPGEITTVGGGLIRKICPVAHTAGASTGTLTPVFTANGTDALPVTIGKVGVSGSILSTLPNRFNTLLGTTATLSLSGDQLTLVSTITET